MKKRVVIGVVGSRDTPVGEAHPRALLSDEEIELIRAIYEEGFLGYKKIGRAFGVSKSYVQNIVTYRRRAATPDAYKTIEVTIDDDGELTGYVEVDDPES